MITSPSLNRAATRSGSAPRNIIFLPPIEQPRAEGASPESSASSLPQSSSPAQRERPQNHQPPPSLNRAAPRRGSFPRIMSLLPPSIEHQPRAERAPPESSDYSSLPQSGSPAQRESGVPRNTIFFQPIEQAPRSGSSPGISLFPPSMELPRAAGRSSWPSESACGAASGKWFVRITPAEGPRDKKAALEGRIVSVSGVSGAEFKM